MRGEIYKKLIQAAEGPTYIDVCTRVALYILAVTEILIHELLPLKVNQLQTFILVHFYYQKYIKLNKFSSLVPSSNLESNIF